MSKHDFIDLTSIDDIWDTYCAAGVDDSDEEFFIDPDELEMEADETALDMELLSFKETEVIAKASAPKSKQKQPTEFHNDSTNADFLVGKMHGNYIFDIKEKCFRLYDGRSWCPLRVEQVIAAAEGWFRGRYDMAKSSICDEVTLKCLNGDCNRAKIKAALELLKGRENMSREVFDVNKTKICVKNGVVNLVTGVLEDHDKNLWQTQYIDVKYDEQAFHGSRFEEFLREITCGDEELTDYLQACFGRALLGETSAQVYLLLGNGANGKTVLTESISAVVKQFQFHLPASELLTMQKHSSGHSAFWVKTAGKRFVFTSELPCGKALNEAFIKVVTGGGELTVRDVGKAAVTFAPQFTMYVDTNALPPIKGTDHGIRRRMVVIPFARTFQPEEQDTNLKNVLKSKREQEAILAWLVEGTVKVTNNPYLLYDYPETVSVVTEAYRGQAPTIDEERAVIMFLENRVVEAKGKKMYAADVFRHFQNFREEKNLPEVNDTKFGLILKQNGIRKRRSAKGNVYLDIEIKN